MDAGAVVLPVLCPRLLAGHGRAYEAGVSGDVGWSFTAGLRVVFMVHSSAEDGGRWKERGAGQHDNTLMGAKHSPPCVFHSGKPLRPVYSFRLRLQTAGSFGHRGDDLMPITDV